MGYDQFAYGRKRNGKFIVKNIASNKKTIKIFLYPIPYGKSRDLLAIPGVSESDIRASLLKGELLNKCLVEDIFITDSDIGLLQFNDEHKQFLSRHGITYGVEIGPNNFMFKRHIDVKLIGSVDNSNTIYFVPSAYFQNTEDNPIVVYKNGVKQAYLDDFTIAESGGAGTGFDTIIMTVPPLSVSSPPDILTADYSVGVS